jgi:hypothetical protein
MDQSNLHLPQSLRDSADSSWLDGMSPQSSLVTDTLLTLTKTSF